MFANVVVAFSLFGAVLVAADAVGTTTHANSNVPEAVFAKKIASNNAKKMRSAATSSAGRNNKGSAAVKMTEEATSWVQYSLYGEGSDCTGDAHYLYWQASDTCIAAETISGYNDYGVDNYVKVSCAQSGDEITLTNEYFSDSSCSSSNSTKTLVTSVNAVCSEQQTGAFNANTNPYINLDDDSLVYDEYGTLVGNLMATACLSSVSQPWTQIDNPNGLADVLYDDDDCGGYPAQADLFVYNVCSKQNASVRASSLGDYVKLTSCDESSFEASFSYYEEPDCSGTPVATQDTTILGADFCFINIWAQNSVGAASNDYNFCLTPLPSHEPTGVPPVDDDRSAAVAAVDAAHSAAVAVALLMFSTLTTFYYQA